MRWGTHMRSFGRFILFLGAGMVAAILSILILRGSVYLGVPMDIAGMIASYSIFFIPLAIFFWIVKELKILYTEVKQ